MQDIEYYNNNNNNNMASDAVTKPAANNECDAAGGM